MTLVAIMRPQDRLEESMRLAEQFGFQAICASPIEIELRDSEAFDFFLDELRKERVDLVMFSSATAVQSALDLAQRRSAREDFLRHLRRTEIVAIGPATCRKLEKEGLHAEGIPEEFTSEGLVQYAKKLSRPGARCYVLRSDQGSGALLPGLRQAGLQADEVVVYSLMRREGAEDLQRLIDHGERGEVDVFLFTSSLSARILLDTWSSRSGMDAVMRSLSAKIVGAIGPPTKETLESYGIRVDVMPARATFIDLLQAVKDWLEKKPRGC
ncbi:MAG: uroporphyrinogen-III synthase [Methanomassiliicoccales archaeon]